MSTCQFKKIVSLDNITFFVPLNHRIFEKGIFCELNEDQITPIPAEYLNYIIYQCNIPIEKVPELLRLILPYCINLLEKKCVKKLKQYFINIQKNFAWSNINMIDIIQTFETPIDFDCFEKIVLTKISKSYILNKSSIKIWKTDDILNYEDFDMTVFNNIIFEIQENENLMKHIIHNINFESCYFGTGTSTITNYTCEYSTMDMVKLAIDLGAKLESSGHLGRKPLHTLLYRMYRGRCGDDREEIFESIKYIIEKGANINSRDIHNSTPLHYACSFLQLKIVKFLIENGADIEYEDKSHKRALNYACERRNLEIIKFLIENGANIVCKIPYEYKQASTPE